MPVTPSPYRDRQLMMYWPSNADRERWRALAKASGRPLASWIYEYVEFHLKKDAESEKLKPSHESGGDWEEVRRLKEELKLKTDRLELAEAELYKIRYGSFNILGSEDSKEIDKALVDLLQEGKTVDGREILEALGIPSTDGEAMRLVYNQLETLRRFGRIKETPNGWRWIK